MAILTETFESGLGSWTSTGTPTVVTTAYAAGTHGLKIDTSAGGTAFITRHPTNPALDVWRYYAFALYVPDWSTFWDGGNQWTPYILDFDPADNFPNGSIYIAPTSSSTGVLAVNYGGGGGGIHQSASVPMGAWVSIEVGYMLDSGFLGNHRFWVNGTDSGIFTTLGATGAPPATGVSFGDNGYLGDTGGADISYYIDQITVDSSPTGLIDLSGALVPGGGGGGDVSSSGGVRVSIAFSSPTFTWEPTWTDIAAISPSLVARYEINRGNEDEFEHSTDDTATVTINDREGILDPTNAAGAYYTLIEPLKQIKLELWNPIAEEWQCRFRGFIEEYNYVVDPWTHQNAGGDTIGNMALEIECQTIPAPLSRIEMQPGEFGFSGGPYGVIFYEDEPAQTRIEGVWTNTGIPDEFLVCFSLNVNLQESTYSAGQNVMEVIQEAVDAEFPTVANDYADRFGRFVVHGRLAKFDPDTVSAGAGDDAWDFHHWKSGDGKAVALSPTDTAQIRAFSFNRGESKVYNSALCTPKNIAIADIAGQYVKDLTSIGQFGYRSWSSEDLIVDSGTLTGNNAKDECLAYANYIKLNYAEPRNRVTQLAFKSMDPAWTGAAATWSLLTKCDISDLIDITVSDPGVDNTGGFNAEPFFIEGIRETAEPLNGEYALVTLELSVSPQSYFSSTAGLDGE